MGKEKKAKPGSGRLIARVLVFAALSVLLVLAFLDFQAKRAAQNSYNALQAAMDSSSRAEDLTRSGVAPLLQGNPKIQDIGTDGLEASRMQKLSWPGIFRTYSITIVYEAGDDPGVETIEGPATK